MTPADLQREREYVYAERVGMLTQSNRQPTQIEHDLAMADVERMELELWNQEQNKRREV